MDMASTNTQNVNITTITTLVMYELSSGDPASMFKNFSYSTLTASAVAAKENYGAHQAAIPAVNLMNPIFSTMYGKFVTAVGGSDPYDNALDSIGKITAMNATSVTLTGTAAAGVSTTCTSAPCRTMPEPPPSPCR